MKNRRYDKEFKVKALELYRNGKPGMDICNDLGIPQATFWTWLKKLNKEGTSSFVGSGKIKPANEGSKKSLMTSKWNETF